MTMKEDYRSFLVSARNVDECTLREAFEAGYLAGQASTKGTVSDAAEIKLLHERVKELETDLNEQCRLNGMGSEREARLMARVEELERERDELERLFGVAFKQCEALKAQESSITHDEWYALLNKVKAYEETLKDLLEYGYDRESVIYVLEQNK